MSIHFNPNSPTSDARVVPIPAQYARQAAFSGSSTLSSLAQQGGEDVAEGEPKPKASNGEAGSIGCWDIIAAPFRAVAYLVNSLWECLCGKKETVDAEEKAPKPAKPASSEFDRALKAKGDAAPDAEEFGEIFHRLPSNHQKRYNDFLWVLSAKDTPRKEFDRSMHDLSDEERRELRVIKDAHSRLDRFTSFVAAQKIKDLADDDKLTARAKACKAFDKLASGQEDQVGNTAKRELITAALILRGVEPAEGDGLSEQQEAALGDFDAPLKKAIKCLVQNNMMLLGTQHARDSIRDFVKAVSSDAPVSADRIRQQYKTLDKEAAEVLNLAVSHAKDQPSVKGLVSDCVPADAQLVLRTAALISQHDNGAAHCGIVARREAEWLREDRGNRGDRPRSQALDMGFAAS